MSADLGPRGIRYLGVIGWPVAHSFSPLMQEAAFRAAGINARYGAFPVERGHVTTAIAGAEALGFVGLNVTVPHKEEALACCDPDGEARGIGAVNTVVFRPGARPAGLNTDAHGFRMTLVAAGLAGGLRDAPVLLLGAGGAARAVLRVLLDEGARVIVLTRSARRVDFADRPPVEHREWSASTLASSLAEARLVVDATPRGLDATAPPIDLSPFDRHAAVIDLTVRPTTALLEAARAHGCRVALSGAAMLVHQGARAFEAWFQQPAPVEEMAHALNAAMGVQAVPRPRHPR